MKERSALVEGVIAAAGLRNFSGNRAIGSQREVARAQKLVRVGLGQWSMNQFTATIGHEERVSILQFSAQVSQRRVGIGGVENQILLARLSLDNRVVTLGRDPCG